MKKTVQYLVLGCFLALLAPKSQAKGLDSDTTAVGILLEETGREIRDMVDVYIESQAKQRIRLNELDMILISKTHYPGQPDYVEALEEKLKIKENMEEEEESLALQLLRLRYTKGLEIIKLLYEKVLSLDHHFSSIQTFQQVNAMANPNSYPAFEQHRNLLDERMKKRGGNLKLPAILQSNPYLSATFSIASIFFSEADNTQKEDDLKQISCILDFTVRMNNDLNLIYYETEYLNQNNQTLEEDCLALFAEYTKPIGYFKSLDKCRKEDDWDAVHEAIDRVFKEIDANGGTDPGKTRASMKTQVNLEFSLNRLLDYIDKYSAFVSSGEKYYKKFLVIVSNYGNETACLGQLPRQFTDLKKDIEMSIEKFENSYRLSELKGSKLKDLLYGLPETN
ncbi:MAG: hypothetical protein IPL65_02030 [Lewinellaceae bacterium]|nr:hypothetical protein [Lewinellaceae bacterium]